MKELEKKQIETIKKVLYKRLDELFEELEKLNNRELLKCM